MKYIREYRPIYSLKSSYNLHFYLIQCFSFLYLAYRHASRNYSNYGYLDSELFNFNRRFVMEISSFKILKLSTFQFIYDFINRPSPACIESIQLAIIVLCICGFLGFFPRLMAFLSLILSLHITGFIIITNAEIEGHCLIFISMIILVVSPRDLHYKINRFKPFKKGNDNLWPIYLLIFLIGSYYSMSGLNKIIDCGLNWPFKLHLENQANRSIDESIFYFSRFSSPYIASILDYKFWSPFLGCITLIGELFFISILWFSRYRFYFVISMISLHFFVFYLTGINFTGNSILLLICCLNWNNFLTKLTVYYDNDCGFCKLSIKYLEKINFFTLITYKPNSIIPKQIDKEAVKLAISSIDENSEVYYASEVFEQILSKNILLFPISIIFKIPGFIYISDFIYMKIAKKRHKISQKIGVESCAINEETK